MLLLSDRALVEHFKNTDEPLPFSVSSIRRDRYHGTLGGIPFHPVGGKKLYSPNEVRKHIANLPARRAKAPVAILSPGMKKRGAPKKLERIRASELGITVSQLRAMGA